MRSCSPVLVAFLLLLAASAPAQQQAGQEMTKDQWQQEMNRLTTARNQDSARLKAISTSVDSLQGLSTRLDDENRQCLDALYALVGSNASEADAFRKEIDAAESQANELSRLSDADLMNRSADVDSLAARVGALQQNKLAVIPEFYDRLTALNDKVKALQTTLGGQTKIYTVGTWSRDRDCLWNIARKREIYNNAWWWPKIWQGNRDQIRDPDIIHTGQKLKIPKADALTADEQRAARRYYARKGGK